FLSSYSNFIPMHVASATPQEELRRIVGRIGLAPFFVEVHGYPTRKDEVLSGIKNERGLTDNEICMIGDTMVDYEAARKSDTLFFGRCAGSKSGFPPGTKVFTDFFQFTKLIGLPEKADSAEHP